VPFYRSLGQIPPKRHTQFRDLDGHLFSEELVGQEGFAGRSSLLYHRHRPTAITEVSVVEEQPRELVAANPLRPRHLRTTQLKTGGDAVLSRHVLLGNDDLTVCFVAADEPSPLHRRSFGDDLFFVQSGHAILESVFGSLPVGPGDYVVVPAAVTHRWVPDDGETLRALVIEANGHVGPPAKDLSEHGQFLEHSPYCERDLRGPESLVVVDEDDVEVLVRHRGGLTSFTYARHPFDVVGWDGCAWPWAFNIADFEPITGRIHQPPPVHETFAGDNFAVASFVPRKLDYHPDAIPAPYNHSNVDSDELLFYVDGQFTSRTGSNIEAGSISMHPSGFPHGPQPGAVEASLGVTETTETAVMIDTFAPLLLGPAAADCDDETYPRSWVQA
jgi:homogentisate 1,2-dioxygenase